MDPLTKRAISEGAGALGSTVLALTMSTQEVALAVSIVAGAIGVIVWLVRLEGRVNTLIQVDEIRHATNTEKLDDMKEQIEKIATRVGAE